MLLTALIATALLQGTDDDNLERRVERFLAGDDMRGGAIRSAGPPAMSLLRTHRSNLKANDVMREIRQAAAAAEDRPIARRLADLKPKLDAGKTPFLDAVESALGGDFRWTVDPRAFDAVVTCEVTPPKEGSGLDVL